MAANVWPVDAVSGAPSYTGRILRQMTGLQWARNPARPLGAQSGIVAGTPTSIATCPTSTTYQVTPFGGVIDGETSAVAGAYNFSFDTNQTGSVNAADATNPRIDLLYVKVSDPAEGDGSTNPIIELKYLAGTAAASPSQPVTPARSIPVFAILVPKSGSGSPVVSFVGSWAVAAGGVLPVASSTGYPASPHEGLHVDDAALNGMLRYTGSAWQPVTTDTGWTAVPVGVSWQTPAGNDAAEMRRRGTEVEMHGLIQTVSGNFAASSTLPLISAGNLPAAWRPAHKINVVACGSGPGFIYRLIVDIDGSMTLITGTSTNSYVDLACVRYSTD